jgi:hypothetical protein
LSAKLGDDSEVVALSKLSEHELALEGGRVDESKLGLASSISDGVVVSGVIGLRCARKLRGRVDELFLELTLFISDGILVNGVINLRPARKLRKPLKP